MLRVPSIEGLGRRFKQGVRMDYTLGENACVIDIKCHNGGMFEVLITAEAREAFARLPLSMQARVQDVFQRLVDWPAVSGAKPLRKELKGTFRIRSGDYRILFTVD